VWYRDLTFWILSCKSKGTIKLFCVFVYKTHKK